MKTLTIEIAKKLKPGDILYSKTEVYSTGEPRTAKVNGKPKVWKTRPNDVKVPIKVGLYLYFYIGTTEVDLPLSEWEVEDDK